MSRTVRRVASGVALLLLLLWAIWWAVALAQLELPFAKRTWFVHPAFAADFWTQPDYAARMWMEDGDPYSVTKHLFHYPPIVIRLFLWSPFFTVPTACRIWVVALIALMAYATVVAWRERNALDGSALPLPVALALVFFSFPVVFQLERANFDLITLMAMLAALPLLRKRTHLAEFAAGALLAVGPWVKIYPGFLGAGLLSLRRWRAFAGFVVAGGAIFLAAPSETMRSFDRLRDAIERTKLAAEYYPLGTWSHSLSMGWLYLTRLLGNKPIGRFCRAIPPEAVALVLVLVPLAWVSLRVFRARKSEPLTFPYLLWVVSLASFVPQIANDYSLAFLPLAAVATFSRREHWGVWALFIIGLATLQPFAFPASGLVLLVPKACGVLAVGASVARRAREATAPNVGSPELGSDLVPALRRASGEEGSSLAGGGEPASTRS